MEKVKKFSISGSEGKQYNLDDLDNKVGSREDNESPLVLQIYLYNPQSKDLNKRSPIPKNLKIGQLWTPRIDKTL